MPGSTTTLRGYGSEHQKRRAELAPLVASGMMRCAKCGRRIKPGQPWDLGHVDGIPKRLGRYSGPEHRGCNRATNSKASKPPRRRHPPAAALAFFKNPP